MIITLDKFKPRTGTGWLSLIFKNRALLINFEDITSTTHESWKILLEKISTKVITDNIDIIVLDLSYNPQILDKHYGIDSPSQLEMLESLKQIRPSYILTQDYRYYYNPVDDIIFFSPFLWTIGGKLLDVISERRYESNTVYDTTIDKSKTILCLNASMHWHRIYLFSLLADSPWFDQIGYSFIYPLENRLEAPAIASKLTAEEIDKIKLHQDKLPILIEEDQFNKDISWRTSSSSIHSAIYRDYAVNLVTETSVDDGVNLTEKSCKVFMAYQIPIIIGPMGVNKFYQDIGFDMFGDYVPWSTWDTLTDHKLKIKMIVDFLDSIMTQPDKILEFHQQCHARLIKNKEYFHSEKFQNLLLSQIQKISQ